MLYILLNLMMPVVTMRLVTRNAEVRYRNFGTNRLGFGDECAAGQVVRDEMACGKTIACPCKQPLSSLYGHARDCWQACV